MKRNKSNKSNFLSFSNIISICILLLILIGILPNLLGLYKTMLGETGLKNTILAISLKSVHRLAIGIPILIVYILILKHHISNNRKSLCSILTAIGMAILFFIPFSAIVLDVKTRYTEQKNINNKHFFADTSLLFNCISDLINDDYEEYTINEFRLNSWRHTTSHGRRGRSPKHSEYTVSFYDENHKIVESQIGINEYESFSDLIPKGFDTKITVYKNSGFIRSIEPTVAFSSADSYENYFTISISGDQIVYEKNVSIRIEGLAWCGFGEGESEDMQNAKFSFGADSNDTIDADHIGLGKRCMEVCLYTWIDGKFRRVSNILRC